MIDAGASKLRGKSMTILTREKKMDDTKLLDEKMLSAVTGIPVKTLQFWRTTGAKHAPPFIKLGKRVFYRPQEIDEWVDGKQSFQKAGIAKNNAY